MVVQLVLDVRPPGQEKVAALSQPGHPHLQIPTASGNGGRSLRQPAPGGTLGQSPAASRGRSLLHGGELPCQFFHLVLFAGQALSQLDSFGRERFLLADSLAKIPLQPSQSVLGLRDLGSDHRQVLCRLSREGPAPVRLDASVGRGRGQPGGEVGGIGDPQSRLFKGGA
jgi:hypothetical protein